MPKITLTYEQALDELESIVAAVEGGQLPIGQLTTQIKRGQELLAHCKNQLQKVRKDVQTILDDEQK